MLNIKLLTSTQLLLNGLSLSSAVVGRGLALFAYVAASKDPCPRGRLLDLLWTDVTEKQAQENLRVLLYNVRQILGDYLSVTRTTVELNRRLPFWSDLDAFSSITDHQVAHDPLLLGQILDLYGHDFMDGFYIANAPVFEAWLEDKRRYFRAKAMAGWQQLTDLHWAAQRHAEAIAANERLLALAPWHEDAHQRQMHLLMATGQRSAALSQYELCCRQLNEALDSQPSAQTTSLYEQIRGTSPIERGNSASFRQVQQAPTTENGIVIQLGTMPANNRLFGRQQELKTLHQWAVVERCRAISISGIGGQGKTTLAASFVKTLTETLPDVEPAFDGIIWHSLRNVPHLEDILKDWIFRLSEQQVMSLPPTLDRQIDLLSGYLKKKRFLFVLDDAESVLDLKKSDQEGKYNAYAQLWRCFVEQEHQCCLLVVGREWINHLRNHDEHPMIYRRLLLDSLDSEASRQLITRHGLHINQDDFSELHHIYAGNPLMLDLVGQTIDELFFGDVASFLSENCPFLGEIGAVLEQQVSMLTHLEQELLTWLALEDRPVSTHCLWANLLTHPSKREYYSALTTLLGRSLIRQQGPLFDVPNLILQYVRQRLLDGLYLEITDAAERIAKQSSIRVTTMQLNRYALHKLGTEKAPAGKKVEFLATWIQRLYRLWEGQQGFAILAQKLLAILDEESASGAALTSGYVRANLQFLINEEIWLGVKRPPMLKTKIIQHEIQYTVPISLH